MPEFIPLISPTRRFLLLLTVALMVVWVALAIAAYDRLPDTVPTHFGLDGTADAFHKRSLWSWYALPVIGVLTTVMLLAIAHFTHSKPSMYNVPGKDKLLELPHDAQQPLLEQLAICMTLMAMLMVVLFAALHYDTWRVATTAQNGLSWVSWTGLGGSMLGFSILFPIWLWRFDSQINAAHAASRPNPKRNR